MIEYRRGNLWIDSDFEIRNLMENGIDVDLFIPLDSRTLNLYIEDIPNYIDNRIQLGEVRSIIIRFSTDEEDNQCTVHFLRSIDIQSATMNFVMEYKEYYIRLESREYSIEMYLRRKLT